MGNATSRRKAASGGPVTPADPATPVAGDISNVVALGAGCYCKSCLGDDTDVVGCVRPC